MRAFTHHTAKDLHKIVKSIAYVSWFSVECFNHFKMKIQANINKSLSCSKENIACYFCIWTTKLNCSELVEQETDACHTVEYGIYTSYRDNESQQNEDAALRYLFTSVYYDFV